ncbi:MAG TPA: oxygen-independent coproporphyrinogen III oxidase [Kofleriaceae bacterium]|nr:oxygen-independent coproporphyrinogen III oxidase [Kofleriaceae bacterium]
MPLPAELTPESLAELSSRGPRYTSYPPATEFAPIGPEAVVAELAEVRRDGAPISLYIHVPFCRSLCWYCGCNVIPSRDTARGEHYVDVVATELALLAEQLGVGFPIAEVALGGGSPNFLTPHSLRTLRTAIDRAFRIRPDARMSVELDPRDTTTAQVEAFADAGFRSLSVGVQDFSAVVQDAIHRHQTAVQTGWLIERARQAGFTDVNVDIVYGLPRQHESSFLSTIDTVIGLAPDRIALFGYAHLPDRLPHQRLVEKAGRVLDRYERATLLLAAIDRLTSAGYIHLGLDHFAKPGSALARAAEEKRMVRTFQGYVEHRADSVIGLGTSAISSTPRMFWQNYAELAPWEDAIGARQLPVHRGTALDADDQIRRALIERLMCDGEADLDQLEQRFGIEPMSYFAKELDTLAQDAQLAHLDDHTIRTTALGKLLVRNVCMLFDRYHHEDRTRFSSTI